MILTTLPPASLYKPDPLHCAPYVQFSDLIFPPPHALGRHHYPHFLSVNYMLMSEGAGLSSPLSPYAKHRYAFQQE